MVHPSPWFIHLHGSRYDTIACSFSWLLFTSRDRSHDLSVSTSTFYVLRVAAGDVSLKKVIKLCVVDRIYDKLPENIDKLVAFTSCQE